MLTIDAISRKDIGAVLTGCGYEFLSNYLRMGSGRALGHLLSATLGIEMDDETYGRYMSRYSIITLLWLMESRHVPVNGDIRNRRINFVRDDMTATHAAMYALYGMQESDSDFLVNYTLNNFNIDNVVLADIILDSIVRGSINVKALASFIKNAKGQQIKITIDKLYANAHKLNVKDTLVALSNRSDYAEICRVAVRKIAEAMGGSHDE
mgnify:CR=1 FL=1